MRIQSLGMEFKNISEFYGHTGSMGQNLQSCFRFPSQIPSYLIINITVTGFQNLKGIREKLCRKLEDLGEDLGEII
jgi:hypothetical protein